MGEAFGGQDPPNKYESRLPVKWADEAMFQAEGFGDVDLTTGVLPSVRLLWMTPDPLGAIAAMAKMYEGKVVRDMGELTYEDRRSAFENVLKTHLDTPLEAVKFHFLFEGVDRATTHQVVRSRHQTYAQESLRFAVVDDLRGGTSLPPSLWGSRPLEDELSHDYGEEGRQEQTAQTQAMRYVWDDALRSISTAYDALIGMGMPAEEARGLLPHATATRIQVVTDLRTLKAEAGNRLCTQAQFHWRLLFSKVVEAIRMYGVINPREQVSGGHWQFNALADSEIFRPVCYQIGHCPFKASFDRACSIRQRVDIRAKHGSTDSREWHKPLLYDDPSAEGGYGKSEGIRNEEWLMDPSAAVRRKT